jgi:ubiquinone/menaquinone biosynthesis C-methylase UbiE
MSEDPQAPHPPTPPSSEPGAAAMRESYTYPRLQVPLFGTEYLEYARRLLFARHPDYLPALVRLLDVHPGMTVADVGSGTGFYTRLIASRLQGEGNVIGIDSDPALLAAARQATAAEGWDEIVTFLQGTATALPMPDGVADLVFANGVLWVLKQPGRMAAVREMLRVTRPGGRALVAEPDGGLVTLYDPQRPRLQELEMQSQAAFIAGSRALDDHDYTLGRKLAELFHAAGFERIRLYPRLFVAAGCDLGPDPKQGLLDRVKEYQQALAGLISQEPQARARRERQAAILRAGGMDDASIAEHQRLTIDRLRDLTGHPERILEDTSVYLYGGVFCEGYHV